MTKYEAATLRTAFCILPQNVDEYLSFYTDILGLKVIRRDEGFIRFNTTPAIICLWEIGHIHRNLAFPNHVSGAVAAKSVIFLDVPTNAAADAMREACRKRGLAPTAPFGRTPGAEGFSVKDPNACYWTITVRAGAVPAEVHRFGVFAEDFDTSVTFYRDVMRLRPVQTDHNFSCFAASAGVELAVVRRDSVPGIERLTPAQQRAHLTMPALGYNTEAEVDGVSARLRKAGARLTADPAVHGWHFYAAYFTDPDANIWEVFTPTPEGK